MQETERIRDQLTRAFNGPAWYGPAVREALQGVTAEMAAARPIPTAHNIWEIVLHIAVWHDVVARRLEGVRVDPTPEQDFPRVTDVTREAWASALGLLDTSFQRLMSAIGGRDEARFDQPVVEGSSSVYVTLHGVVQHDVYHAGQIAILKKG